MPPAGSREAPTPAGELLDRYAEYLRLRRGLKASTIRNYRNHARDFLAERERSVGGLALEALDVAIINDYMLRESRRVSVSSTQAAAGVLRSFLRFLLADGVVDRDLAVAVPTVAKWRLASLVRAVDPLLLAGLLASCERGTPIGRRDFAIITMLSRLGLRIGEVAALRLSDLVWRAGEIVIRGKGERHERLPLPVDVGEAIVDWLGHGRPDCASRFVFTRSRAPHVGLHPTSLNGVVQRACQRAGGAGDHGASAAAHGRDRDASRRRRSARGRAGCWPTSTNCARICSPSAPLSGFRGRPPPRPPTTARGRTCRWPGRRRDRRWRSSWRPATPCSASA